MRAPHPGEVLKSFVGDMHYRELAKKSGLEPKRARDILHKQAQLNDVDIHRLVLLLPETNKRFWQKVQGDYSEKVWTSYTNRLKKRKALTKPPKEAPPMKAKRGAPVLLTSEPLPGQQNPDQHFECIHRSECLKFAARLNAKGFACTGCPDVTLDPGHQQSYQPQGSHHLAINQGGH